MHIENLLFILLIAIAVLFRLLASKVGEAKKGEQDRNPTSATRPSPAEPIERAPAESDAERIRRFLEALGQPADTKPPPPVAPRTDIPPRPLAPVKPPTAHVLAPWKLTREERRKRHVILQSPPLGSEGNAEKVAAPPITVTPTFEVHEGPLPAEQPPIVKVPAEAYAAATRPAAKQEESKTDIAILLASTSGLRNAIILREIFGRPRGMQRLEEMRDSWVPL
jgi:hypothetical protein